MLSEHEIGFVVMPASPDVLPDMLRPGLRLVFVGTAAGRRSAEVGAYYAHRGNRFWRTLHEVGLTPRLYAPHDYPLLMDVGIGFTDVAKGAAGMDHEIAAAAFDADALAAKIKQCRPRAIAFTSKRAASYWLRRPTGKIAIGLQADTAQHGTVVFVLPSPSGAATRYWSIAPWHEMARACRNSHD